jgi:hypothetical protein
MSEPMTARSEIAICCLLPLFVFLCFPTPLGAKGSGSALVIENSQTGSHVDLALNHVLGLTIRFFHSYDRQWVEESFTIEDGRFVPSEVLYRSDTYDYRDQRYRCRERVEKNQVRLSDIRPRTSDVLRTIVTRVAYTRPQQLIVHRPGGSRSYAFTAWGRPGERLVFAIKKAK